MNNENMVNAFFQKMTNRFKGLVQVAFLCAMLFGPSFVVAQSTGNQEEQGGMDAVLEDFKTIVDLTVDWFTLSYATYSGESDAELQSLFSSFLKDYADHQLFQAAINALDDSNKLEQTGKDFFAQTGVRIYYKGKINAADLPDRLKNFVQVLNDAMDEKIQNAVTPYIIVEADWTGDKDTGFQVAITTTTSEEVNAGKYGLDQTDEQNPFIATLTPSSDNRIQAAQNLRQALVSGLESLGLNFTDNFLPELLISYEEDLYKTGEVLELPKANGQWADLYLLNQKMAPPQGSISWSITPENEHTARTEIEENHVRFPLDKSGEYILSATTNDDSLGLTLDVTNFEIDLDIDVKNLLADLLKAQLEPMLENVLEQAKQLAEDSINSWLASAAQLNDLERFNYPIMEGDGQLTPLLDEPRILGREDTIFFNTDPLRKETMAKLRKQKKVVLDIKKAEKLVSFIRNVANNEESFEVILNDMIANSGELLAELAIAVISNGEDKDEEIKAAINDYLTNNLSRLAGEDVSLGEIVPISVEPVSNIPDAYDPNSNYYISPKLPYNETRLNELIAEIEAYQAENPGSFVVVNYSQDVNRQAFLARVPKGAPQGVAEGEPYKVINIINYPGSLIEFQTEHVGDGGSQSICRYTPDFLADKYDAPSTDQDYLTFVAPSSQLISIPYSATDLTFAEEFIGSCDGTSSTLNNASGVLTGFTDGEDTYVAHIENNYFKGYSTALLPELTGRTYIDTYSAGQSDFTVYILENGELVDRSCSLEVASDGELYNASGTFYNAISLACIAGEGYQSALASFSTELNRQIEDNDYLSMVWWPGSDSDKDDWQDRFEIYHNETQKKIFVLSAPLSFPLLSEDRQLFIDQVVSSSNFNSQTMLLLCIPYYLDQISQEYAVNPNTDYYGIRGFQSSIDLSDAPNGYTDFIAAFYKKVVKPSYIYSYNLSYKGELIVLPKQEKTSTTGYERIHNFKFAIDTRSDDYQLLAKNYFVAKDATEKPAATSYQDQVYVRAKTSLDNYVDENDNIEGSFDPVIHGLLESCIAAQLEGKKSKGADEFAHWYRDDLYRNPTFGSRSLQASPEDACFVIGRNQVVYQEAIDGLEALSIALSPTGFDFVADAAGTIYAGFYGDWETAGEFAVGVAAIGASGILLKQAIKGQKKLAKGTSGLELVDNVSGKWSSFSRVSRLNSSILTRIDDWPEPLVRKLDDALGNYQSLSDEIASNLDLLNEFQNFGTKWEGKYSSKIKFIDDEFSDAPDFERMLDDAIPELKNGNQPQNIQDLGRVFDQEYAVEAQRAFDNEDFSKLPHLESFYNQDYTLVSGQVRIKSGVSAGEIEVRPDVLLFKTSSSGNVITGSTIWKECKIRTSSPPTSNQSSIFELLSNGTISKNQLEFEVLSNDPVLVNIGLGRGSMIGIESINQVSVGTNGSLQIISIF